MAALRKIKAKAKKITRRSKPAAVKRTIAKKKAPAAKRPAVAFKPKKLKAPLPQTKPLPQAKEEVLGAPETAVEKTKFYVAQVQSLKPGRRAMRHDLPKSYGKDKIILQVRDPWWLYAYWEVQEATWQKLRQELGEAFYKSRRTLRVYDVSQINFNGSNAHRFFDIHINEYAQSWYIDTQGPGRSWCVDLGIILPDGRFITIVRSNTVSTPLDGPSWVTDEEWMIPEEMFARLYGMGFGLGQSSPVGKAWQERVRRQLSSHALASPGITSPSSPVKPPKARKFWMVVETELIVYGATEPDAHLTVQDKPVKLREDGTFTLRFALPNGKQVIPVKAVSSDKAEERVITPVVTKETK